MAVFRNRTITQIVLVITGGMLTVETGRYHSMMSEVIIELNHLTSPMGDPYELLTRRLTFPWWPGIGTLFQMLRLPGTILSPLSSIRDRLARRRLELDRLNSDGYGSKWKQGVR